MNTKLLPLTSVLLSLVILLTACAPQQPPAPTAEAPTAAPVAAEQPHLVKGTYTVTDDHALKTRANEHAVLLADMRGFVTRDPAWEQPVESQTLGFMTFDAETLSGAFALNLPAQPKGAFNDVNFDGREDKGVQVFALSYQPNLAGGPFAEGDDPATGWATYLTSVTTDAEKSDEVTGGKLIIWSPDAEQQFPSGFGADGLLFTEDDPASIVPAGYSLVDLDKQPFELSQTPTFEVTLNEPKAAEVKDFSNLSYAEAFDKTFEFAKLQYAFNGIAGKEPNWDALYKELKPRVEEAEKNKDPMAFYLALRDFSWALKDKNAYIDGALVNDDFQKYVSGGYGFTVRELDDGRAIVIFVMEIGPAARAGMKVGAEVTQFNGKPISEAISEVAPYISGSSPYFYRIQQIRYFTRGQLGQPTEVTFTNPNEQPKTAALLPETEYESFDHASVSYGAEKQLQPVTYKIIKEGKISIGYVAINSYNDDLNLIMRLFERALQQFAEQSVMGIIIDMRYNSGGVPLGLAGFLSDKEILLGQPETYNQVTGKFEADGARDKVLPMKNQYRFDKMVTLVGLGCADSCEEEAYAFSQVAGMEVMGQYPTAGAFATTKRGQISLPEDISLKIPTERFTLPDGSIFLEGAGVKPAIKVPLDEITVLAENDVILDAAVERVLTPDGIGIQPSAPPKMTLFENSDDLVYSAVSLFSRAREEYDNAATTSPGTLKYTVALSKSENLAWASYWCTSDKEILEQNLPSLQWKFTLDGEEIPLADFSAFDFSVGASQCFAYAAQLDEWTAGEHHLSTVFTITQDINDGMTDYKAGDYIQEYTVYVKP